MNSYNCRISRVIPKDHVLIKREPYYLSRRDYWIQEAWLKLPFSTSLMFARKSKAAKGPWGKWVFIPGLSTRWGQQVPGNWTDPLVLSSIMHYKKT